MPNLSSRLSNIPPVRGTAPWPDHEYVKGWGMFGLPFDSGHVLALRVFAENGFTPYHTVWHRDPRGKWSIHVDGPRLDTACLRYYGSACDSTGFAGVDITWTGPASLRVAMDSPSLQWTLTASSTPVLAALNGIGATLPLATWRPRPMLAAREKMARLLGLGDLQLSGLMPSGHTGILMPQRMYYINDSHARLDGHDLGRPARLRVNPRIGDVPLPARGILAIGQAVWEILDPSSTSAPASRSPHWSRRPPRAETPAQSRDACPERPPSRAGVDPPLFSGGHPVPRRIRGSPQWNLCRVQVVDLSLRSS